ncbi:heme-binding protein [Thalassomonas sp. RHCl1]|uniref:GlcG/HbpS family heme-binding protein n=1 Tax=Thalassomonas sp. RHCl1 TaxID=2995320 RepID=UPI00248CBC6B|nr:heme-binding protein [Thalassomonas sp. RHCl1]
MRNIKTTLSLISALFITSAGAQELLLKQYQLTAAVAEKIAQTAIAECKKSSAHVSVSVVNDQGRLMYFYRGNNTGSNTVHTSFRKAYTAATLKAPTSIMSQMVEAKGLSQLGKMEDDILLLTGGLPMFYKDAMVGAIGLSGSPNPELEESCGKKALELLKG